MWISIWVLEKSSGNLFLKKGTNPVSGREEKLRDGDPIQVTSHLHQHNSNSEKRTLTTSRQCFFKIVFIRFNLINSKNVPMLADLFIIREHSQSLLLKVNLRSTFRNRFLQPATHVSVARKVYHARWKTRDIDSKLATKQCLATSWGFLYLVFCRIYSNSACKFTRHLRHICIYTRAK